MKKLLYLVAIFVTLVVAVASCKKDKDKKYGLIITAQVENGKEYNERIKRVEALTTFGESLAYSTYNGGFSLTLPKMVDDEFLMSFRSGNGLEFSDPNVKGTGLIFLGSSSTSEEFGSNYVGGFIFAKIEDVSVKGTEENFTASMTMVGEEYIYVDRPVTMSASIREIYGNTSYSETYSVSLNKGWNKVYLRVKEETIESPTSSMSSIEITAAKKRVSGMKWYFEDDLYNYAMPSTAVPMKKALKNIPKMPFFKRLSAVND